MYVTKMAETVTNILFLSPANLVSNIQIDVAQKLHNIRLDHGRLGQVRTVRGGLSGQLSDFNDYSIYLKYLLSENLTNGQYKSLVILFQIVATPRECR